MRISFVFLFLGSLLTVGAFAAPRVDLATRTIRIADVAPNGNVYAFGVSREPRGDHTAVVPREVALSDTDGDGTVEWELEADIARRSIWLAVDRSTGEATVAVPQGYPVTELDLTGEHLKKDVTRAVAQIAVPGTLVEVVVVRPGSGVWRATIGLHSASDETRDRGKVTVSTAKLQARVGTTDPAPKHLKKGDVVFFLDSYSATYGLIRVGE